MLFRVDCKINNWDWLIITCVQSPWTSNDYLTRPIPTVQPLSWYHYRQCYWEELRNACGEIFLLAITEVWMHAVSPVNINNFQLILQLPCESCAGSVAVYKWNDFAYFTLSFLIELMASLQVKLSAMSHVENIVVTQINCPAESNFILTTINVNWKDPYNDLAILLYNIVMSSISWC